MEGLRAKIRLQMDKNVLFCSKVGRLKPPLPPRIRRSGIESGMSGHNCHPGQSLVNFSSGAGTRLGFDTGVLETTN